MKIIVLGGAGDMGSRAVEDLAFEQDVELVTIADRDEAAADSWRDLLAEAPAKVEVAPVDATDHEALTNVMRGHDVAASALGPFFKFEPLMVHAAIDAGVNYVSVCDDWIACEKALDEWDTPAREAGVTAVTGMGASPGLTNMLACFMARGLDRVRQIDVSCFQPWSAGGGEAVFRHLLFIMSGEVAAFQGGKAMRVPACSVATEMDMPKYGRRRLYNLGHAEPVSLPRHFPDLEACNFWMGMGTGMSLLVAMAKRGWLAGEKNANRALRVLAPFEKSLAGADPGLSSIRVDVYGEKDGAEAHRMACGTGVMRDYTGLPLSVGALALGRGQTINPGPGVFAPESCFDVIALLPAAIAKDVKGYTDLAMTQLLTEKTEF